MLSQIPKKQLELMQLSLQNATVCIDLEYIDKVLPIVMLETVPGGPLYLAGLMNLAGESIPVIDLAIRLGMARKKRYSLNMSIILCSHQSHQVGLIVDKIIGLSQVNSDILQMANDFEANSPYKATVTIDEKIALIINIEYVLHIDIFNTTEKEKINE
jgi:purine-binding chemotaxis protein CheW